MKLRIPLGCSAASHNGRAIEIDAEGCVSVEDHAAQALRAHGFILCEGEGEHVASVPDASEHPERPQVLEDEIEGLNRRSLFAFLKAKGVGVSLPVTNDELRALARQAIADAASDSHDDE